MKLYFKQRLFSWFDSYDIYDESGNVVFIVKGQLSWGHKLVIYDAAGHELGMVLQKVLTILPKFELYEDGNYLGCLKKELSFLTQHYKIDFNGWYVEGNFTGWNYTIFGGGFPIASISKELFHMTDHYLIEVTHREDALRALMVVLAIDAEKCSQN
ncbi:MAG: LURP-one-related family protein [Eubacteriales bacterium]|nr:LURP-one-related family protein [Eubacteriales bacterium]